MIFDPYSSGHLYINQHQTKTCVSAPKHLNTYQIMSNRRSVPVVSVDSPEPEEQQELDLDIDRDCPRPRSCKDQAIFDFADPLNSGASDYDDIHWLDDSGNPSDLDVLSPDCFMDALSPLSLEYTPNHNDYSNTNIVRCEDTMNPSLLESTYYGQSGNTRGTLSDSEFDFSGYSSTSRSQMRRSDASTSNTSTYSSSSPIFNFPSIQPQSSSPDYLRRTSQDHGRPVSVPNRLSSDQFQPHRLRSSQDHGRFESDPNPTANTFASTFTKHQFGLYNRCLISSKAFKSGSHEWSIRIKQCGMDRQEIGMISETDLEEILVDREGEVSIDRNSYFGARTVC